MIAPWHEFMGIISTRRGRSFPAVCRYMTFMRNDRLTEPSVSIQNECITFLWMCAVVRDKKLYFITLKVYIYISHLKLFRPPRRKITRVISRTYRYIYPKYLPSIKIPRLPPSKNIYPLRYPPLKKRIPQQYFQADRLARVRKLFAAARRRRLKYSKAPVAGWPLITASV